MYTLFENHRTCVIIAFSDCKNEGVSGEIAWNCSKIAFFAIYTIQIGIFKPRVSNTLVFQIGEHFNQSQLVISGYFSSFSNFMAYLVLVEKVRLFCAPSDLIMSLPARITTKTSLNSPKYQLNWIKIHFSFVTNKQVAHDVRHCRDRNMISLFMDSRSYWFQMIFTFRWKII